MRNFCVRFTALLTAAVFLALSGCGSGLSTLEGNVTLDGQPLENGQIAVEPKDGQGTPAGEMIKAGAYSIKELKPGDYIVRINASKVVGSRPAYGNDTNGPQIEITESIIPPRFNANSTLTVTVAAGVNKGKDFALTSK